MMDTTVQAWTPITATPAERANHLLRRLTLAVGKEKALRTYNELNEFHGGITAAFLRDLNEEVFDAEQAAKEE